MDSDTHSVATSRSDVDSDSYFQELDDDQLFQKLNEILASNEIFAAETEMFERYMKRVEPKDHARMTAGVSTSQQSFHSSSSGQDAASAQTGSKYLRKRTKSRGSTSEKVFHLLPEQKTEIASKETEELKEEMEKMKDNIEKAIDLCKAEIEEAEERLADVSKSKIEFEKEIIRNARNANGRVVTEKATKYIEDEIKRKDAHIEKLNLKNAALKGHRRKLEQQLRQKEEMGEVLHEVDFNQLKIENQQYLEKIEEKNADLLQLKQIAANTLLKMNSEKKKLGTFVQESDRITSELKSRTELTDRLESEFEVVEKEQQEAESMNRRFRDYLSTYRVPEVFEYVKETADLRELKRNVRMWERKVEISQMSLKTNNANWQKLKQSVANRPPNPWDTVLQQLQTHHHPSPGMPQAYHN